jgi:hypothetical protein
MKQVLSSYEPVEPPFSLDFKDKSASELRAYSDWFLAGIARRISVLTAAVHRTIGYDTWTPDESPTSLDMLGAWFADVLETRTRSRDEIDAIQAELKFPVAVPATELTPRSYSVIFDVGLYTGRVVLANVKGSAWMQYRKDRRNVDYGQVVLSGVGPVHFNPVRVAIVVATKLVDGLADKSELRRVYEIWTQSAPKTTRDPADPAGDPDRG